MRCIPLLILCLALVLILPQQADAASVSNLTFTRNDDGVSYSVTDCKLSASGALVIPATYNGYPVTSIGSYAFYYCTSLTSVTIGNSVTSIGSDAFYNCTSLTSVTIGNSVTSIGSDAFYNCTSLKSVTIPDSVTGIGDGAFYNCANLTDVYYIGTQAQWEAISIGSNNEHLQNAAVHYVAIQIQDDGTIKVMDNTAIEQLTVAFGKVLDLNGKVLTVESLASFGQIIDSVGGGGLIVENIEITGNNWLPILDETGCYRFYEYEQENLGTKATSDGVIFGFALDFADTTAYTTLLNSEDVQVTVTLAWGSNSKTFAFSTALLQRYAKLQSQFPNLQACMKLNVTGLDAVAEGTTITVTPSFAAVGGKLQTIGAPITYMA